VNRAWANAPVEPSLNGAATRIAGYVIPRQPVTFPERSVGVQAALVDGVHGECASGAGRLAVNGGWVVIQIGLSMSTN
jgi:hypothetical protein